MDDKKKKRNYEGLGALYTLLNDKLPDTYTNTWGNLDVKKVAALLGCTPQAVYRYFEEDRLPNYAVNILRGEIGESNLTYDEIAPFVFK